jgi:hypothetical protein
MTDDAPFDLPEDLSGPAAVRHLAPLLTSEAAHLRLNAAAVQRVDAIGAVVLRAAVERIAQRGGGYAVWITRPSHAGAQAHLQALLGPLPAAVDWLGPSVDVVAHPPVLLGATRVFDHVHAKEVVAELVIAEESHAPRGRVIPGIVLTTAYVSMAHNAIKHGAQSDVDAICAAAVMPDGSYQVAAFNLSPPLAERDDVGPQLLDYLGSPNGRTGDLAGLTVGLGYETSVSVLCGTTALEHDGDVWVTREHPHIDGFLVALDIQL